MTLPSDPLDAEIVHDAARGFLGLTAPDEVARHALLSLMGSSGARSAALLVREGTSALRVLASRGLPGEPPAEFPLTKRAEGILAAGPVPLGPDASTEAGPDVRRLAERLGGRLLVPLLDGERLLGVAVLGERILGEEYDARAVALAREIAELTVLALRPEPSGPEPGREGRRRPGSAAEALRRRHPALRPIVGGSAATLALLEELVALAEYELPVLVTGETGTGKELVARALHDLSPRRGEPFEAVNCAAIPRDLIASALFGHERGAFTGAISTARGAFERAGTGTIFLDEIGDMPLDAQASLLRVLQDRRFSRVGGEKVLSANARIVSATNRDLAEAAAGGTFRADLFYRIQMYSIRLVPLRERGEDIPDLVDRILETSAPAVRHGRAGRPTASPAFLSALARLPFPGNVRELEGLVLGAVVRARGSATLTPANLPDPRSPRDAAGGAARSPASPVLPSRGDRGEASGEVLGEAVPATSPDPADGSPAGDSGRAAPTYSDMERDYIQTILAMTGGNKREAASLMGIPRTTLNARMKKLGL